MDASTPELKELNETNEKEVLIQEPMTKPKRTRQLTDEQRKAASENMRRVSKERIDRLRLASEQKIQEEEEKAKKRLEKVNVKKENLKKLKEGLPVNTPSPEPPVDLSIKYESKKFIDKKKPSKQKVKKYIIESSSSDSDSSSSDSSQSNDYYNNLEDHTDTDENTNEEIIYLKRHGKDKKESKSKSIIKPKKNNKPRARSQSIDVPPKTIIRFI